MRLLIQVSSRSACGAAQPAMTALNAVSTVTVKAPERTARETRDDAKALQRDHSAHFRLDPEQRRIVGAFGHRKDAAGIGAQQHFRRDFGRCGVARCHAPEDSRTPTAYATFAKKSGVTPNIGETKRRGKWKGARVKVTWKTIAPLAI